jgi:hypothetical protein
MGAFLHEGFGMFARQSRIPKIRVSVVLALLLACSGAAYAQTAPKTPPTVVFMTDFGVVDDSVALC